MKSGEIATPARRQPERRSQHFGAATVGASSHAVGGAWLQVVTRRLQPQKSIADECGSTQPAG
jgi:hypothetical protein